MQAREVRPCILTSFAHISTCCTMQDCIKFKLRIFSGLLKEYEPGFFHILLSLVSVIDLEATTEAPALLHNMENDACMFFPSRRSRSAISPCPNSYWDSVGNNTPIYNLDLSLLDSQGMGVINISKL